MLTDVHRKIQIIVINFHLLNFLKGNHTNFPHKQFSQIYFRQGKLNSIQKYTTHTMPDAIHLKGFQNFSNLKRGSPQRQNRIAASCLLPCNASAPTKLPFFSLALFAQHLPIY
jgi:hypothetical protein